MKQRNIKILFLISIFSLGSIAYATTPDWKLPIKKYTPGVINPNVNQSNIKENICKPGWTDTIRPPVSYTNKLKQEQLKTTYKSFAKIWGLELNKYEEDHLISLQLGGDPKDPKNLFPQPYEGNNARKKDVVETKLKKLVCSGTIKLVDAQKAISTDWVKAYNKYAVKDTDIDSTN
jgi:hypothetical protein